MSIIQPRKKIEAGDCVIMFGNKDNASAISIKPGQIYNCRFGAFPHNDLIGKEYGTKVYSKGGYVYALPVSSELWTNYLRHRTQILYSVDIAMVVYRLELKSGSIVVESGTGSGSLTSTLARTVAPTGQVFTFEFHAQRAEAAREDFAMTGLSNSITVTNRDACKEGFLLEEKGLKPETADGVFLDLPSPWEAIPHAKQVLKSGGMLCSFSPCIEQVQRASETMRTLEFVDISTIECLLRPYDVRNTDVEHYTLENLDDAQSDKQTKTGGKPEEKAEGETAKGEAEEEGEENGEQAANVASSSDKSTTTTTNTQTTTADNHRGYKKRRVSTTKTLLVKPVTDIRGHTGYLTFARRL